MLDEQLRLLEVKKGEAETLRVRGGRADEDLPNDLVGIRLVLTSALLAGGFDEPEREDLERREREARELFAVAVSPDARLRASVRRL